MGYFRTIAALRHCPRCGEQYGLDVQFKTNDDSEMPTYNPGDVAADVQPDEYDGIGNGYCPTCQLHHTIHVNEVSFAFLLVGVRSARITMWPATWQFSAKTGQLLVHRLRELPLSPAEIEVAASIPQTDPFNTYYQRFFGSHEVQDGGRQISPRPEQPSGSFWRDELRVWLDAELLRRGWLDGRNTFIEVPVIVGKDHRVRADVTRARFE